MTRRRITQDVKKASKKASLETRERIQTYVSVLSGEANEASKTAIGGFMIASLIDSLN